MVKQSLLLTQMKAKNDEKMTEPIKEEEAPKVKLTEAQKKRDKPKKIIVEPVEEV